MSNMLVYVQSCDFMNKLLQHIIDGGDFNALPRKSCLQSNQWPWNLKQSATSSNLDTGSDHITITLSISKGQGIWRRAQMFTVWKSQIHHEARSHFEHILGCHFPYINKWTVHCRKLCWNLSMTASKMNTCRSGGSTCLVLILYIVVNGGDNDTVIPRFYTPKSWQVYYYLFEKLFWQVIAKRAYLHFSCATEQSPLPKLENNFYEEIEPRGILDILGTFSEQSRYV